MAQKHRMLPVWFFVGVILVLYGIVILITGITEWSHPPSTVLSSLHPSIWWGVLLIIIGAIYIYWHTPRKS